MVFSSVVFLGLFLPLSALLYFASKNRTWRNTVLLCASLFFYAWGEPVYILSMVAVTLIDYAFGRLLPKAEKGGRRRRTLLVLCLILNLLPLFVFKYYNFFIQNVNALLRVSLPALSAAMPIGISFFTFQSMSYAIDVHRGTAEPQRSYAKVLLYVAMFPQLIAGPIVRYADVAREIDERTETARDALAGLLRFAVGLGKKVIFANYAGQAAAILLSDRLASLSVCGAWVGVILYSMQLYFDFSGYSDMAIGLGRLFGFRFKENFNYPYVARSITEFWQRWHISMGHWFRDYVMYPMAISKGFARMGGALRKRFGVQAAKLIPASLATFLTYLLVGLWHGAGWNFILWGAYYATILIIEKLLFTYRIHLDRVPVVNHALVLVIVFVGVSLFYYTDVGELGVFLRAFTGLESNGFWLSLREKLAVCEVFWLIPFMLLGATPLPARLAGRLCGAPDGRGAALGAAYTAALVLLCFVLMLGQSYNPFLYFRF